MKIRRSIFGYGAGIFFLHVLGVLLLISSIPYHPTLIGLAVLSYTFGLRHAFDADHIAAIDNTVRKLRQESRDTTGIGFFFALGHSTIVVIMTIVAVFALHFAQKSFPLLQNIGGVVATIVSASFLFIIGFINLLVLNNLYQIFKTMKTQSLSEAEFEEILNTRGFLARFVGPLFKLVTKSWNMYPIGFLFGLGFDSASEVALLAISAGAAKSAISFTGIIALPILFSAGMSLMDTTDGVFMTVAYNWAFATPIRKIYYNLTVTGLSVVVALLIGCIEVAQIIAPKFGLNDGFWGWVQGIDFGKIGYLLVGLFILTWGISYGIWKFYRIDQRWSSNINS